MKTKNVIIAATAAIALMSHKPITADLIEAVSLSRGIKTQEVMDIVRQTIEARKVAEADMAAEMSNPE